MIAAVLAFLGSVLSGLINRIFGGRQIAAAEQARQDAISEGETRANAAQAANAASTEANVAQAVSDTPDSKAALLNLLRGGKA